MENVHPLIAQILALHGINTMGRRNASIGVDFKRPINAGVYLGVLIAESTDEPEINADARLGMAWWNALSEAKRAFWLAAAQSAVPAEAWACFKRCGAGRVINDDTGAAQ